MPLRAPIRDPTRDPARRAIPASTPSYPMNTDPMNTDPYLDPEIETLPPERLRALQENKLRKQLDYLYARSPFYKDKLAAAGIRREDFRSMADVARFPFTTKEELRESQVASPPLGRHAAAEMVEVIRIHASTGTTGQPSLVGVTRRDAEVWTR